MRPEKYVDQYRRIMTNMSKCYGLEVPVIKDRARSMETIQVQPGFALGFMEHSQRRVRQ